MPAQAGLRERRARSLGGSPLTLHHPFPGALLSSSEAVTAVSVSPPNRVTVAYDQILRETLFSLISHIRAMTGRDTLPPACLSGPRLETYMSTQPCSPLISMALQCSPAEMYISTAALGSLMFRAQSACLVISIFVSLGSSDPRKS